jgi:hypothetical protein
MLLQGRRNYSLLAESREYVEFEIPAAFRRVVLNALTASPTSVDLRSQSAQFYLFADKIMSLCLYLESKADVDYGIHRNRNHKLSWRRYREFCLMFIRPCGCLVDCRRIRRELR